MSQSDGKRRIKIQKLNLDPLSNWFYSRREIGDVNGVKLDAPDRQLVSTILPGQISNTNETYTINAGTDTLNFIYSSLREGQTQRIQDDLYRINNRFVYINPVPGTEQYSSFSQEILRNLLDTASKVFNLARQEDVLGLRNRTYSVPTGQTRTEAPQEGLGQTIWNSLSNDAQKISLEGNATNLQTFFTEVIHGLSPNGPKDQQDIQNSGLVRSYEANIYDFVFGAIDDIQSNDYNRGENSEEIVKITKFLLLKSLINVGFVTTQQVFSLLNQEREYQYEYTNVHTSTPYVKNQSNARFLQNVQYENFENSPSSVDPEYGFYQEQYENSIDPENIFEDLLPNLYVREFYQRADSVNTTLQEQAQKQALLRNYRRLLTLADDSNNIINEKGQSYYNQLENSIQSGFSKEYYRLYSGLLDPEQPAQYATRGLIEKNGSFILGQDQISEFGTSLAGSAFSLTVRFMRDNENTDFSRFLRTQDRDASIAMLENLKSYDDAEESQFEESGYLYSTEYMVRGEQRETPMLDTLFRVYNLQDNNSFVFRLPETYSSTVLQRKNDLPRSTNLNDAKGFILRNRDRRSFKSYNNVVRGLETPSEVLGYKLTKRRSGEQFDLQQIYLGNSGRRRINYTDTQVKYGLEYTYNLSEYRIMYGSDYNTWTVSLDVPVQIILGYLGIYNEAQATRQADQMESFSFQNVSNFQPKVELIEVPVYDDEWNRTNVFERISNNGLDFLSLSARLQRGAGGIAFPSTKVADFPPTAPTMQFFPRAFIDSQIDVSINPTSGKVGTIILEDGSFDESLEIISIGDNEEKIREIKEYQNAHSSEELASDEMRYRYKGQQQIKNIIFYRTTGLNLNVQNYKDLYPSFNPDSNTNVLVRKFSTKQNLPEGNEDIVNLLSYDIRDNIQPNINYYYTCIVEDVHGNISNPSEIYRVRLLSENGMVIPEISTVVPVGSNDKSSQKSLARYVKIDASSIQTFPTTTEEGDNIVSKKSLGEVLKKKIQDQSYIVRFTSKDTGRKFDLKLNFIVRVNGDVAIGDT